MQHQHFLVGWQRYWFSLFEELNFVKIILIGGTIYLREVNSLHYLIMLYAFYHGASGLIVSLGAAFNNCLLWFVGIQGVMLCFEVIQFCIGLFVFLVTTMKLKNNHKKMLGLFTAASIIIPLLIVLPTKLIPGVVDIPDGKATNA